MQHQLRVAVRLVVWLLASLCWFLLIFLLFRFILMQQHMELLSGVPVAEIVHSYGLGLHFDLRVVCIAMLPVLFLAVFQGPLYRTFCIAWLTTCYRSLYFFA
jgi:hypothetical protein